RCRASTRWRTSRRRSGGARSAGTRRPRTRPCRCTRRRSWTRGSPTSPRPSAPSRTTATRSSARLPGTPFYPRHDDRPLICTIHQGSPACWRLSPVSRDLIGERGEALFRVAITKWCDGQQWFRADFLGEKEEGLDFEVVLIDSAVFRAVCYVQVKATAKP